MYSPSVELWEGRIRTDELGHAVHHPLNGPYYSGTERVGTSYGHLTFAGHDLDKSDILDDVRVFHLEFYGEPPHLRDREAWADPLRAKALRRLSPDGYA